MDIEFEIYEARFQSHMILCYGPCALGGARCPRVGSWFVPRDSRNLSHVYRDLGTLGLTRSRWARRHDGLSWERGPGGSGRTKRGSLLCSYTSLGGFLPRSRGHYRRGSSAGSLCHSSLHLQVRWMSLAWGILPDATYGPHSTADPGGH